MYKHPGVYIEHVPSNTLSIEAASTSVTAFVGHVKRGVAVTAGAGEPIFISSPAQYAQKFGPLVGGAGGIRNAGDQVDAFGHAIAQYFANGGAKAFVVPVAHTTGAPASATASLVIANGSGQSVTLTLTATSDGEWANDVMFDLSKNDTDDYTLTLGTLDAATRQAYDDAADDAAKAAVLADADFDVELEVFAGLDIDPDSGQAVKGRVDGLSRIVTVASTPLAASDPADLQTGVRALSAGGSDANAPVLTHYSAALERLKDYRSISTIVLPGLSWADNVHQTIYQSAIAHAEFMQNRMVLVDPSNLVGDRLETAQKVKQEGFPTSPYSALYYPHLTVGNPFYDAETNANVPATFEIGPSAMAAGLWGRIDGTRGVWKAPAGLEATVRGSFGPNVKIGNAIQDNLNEWGVNCIRSIIGPSVVWGGRTLATKTKPQYRYIPVRRTQNMIGESLYNALQAVVFEPNDHKLWSGLRASVGNFMDGLHRAGAFQGEKASDAYFVNCGLGATMTQGDIDAGIVRVVVGFAPLKPAEFVVVQIQQIVGQTA
ncbi:phage tail sheath family protein [Shimia sp. MMG029]|uniref:phage tail sheath family protein n=1 Tax=Shimia sp. MMG029 TaxID=3021978 RepID=UPI0022FF435A|nr:phage tail sheath C-terminal domain-containing protein [Shimia sp. MMG029]MDA5558496.1 phage tail sheath subtilisin-like domain-containing protein [Shimia sp. MMG029]